MKYQRAKDVAKGVIIATLVVGVMPTAFAKVGGVTIPVNYNNIKIVVDGKEVKTDKEPFTYEGTTYLPVRAVGEAVGKEVKWDSATQTVTLSGGEQTEAEVKKPEETIVEKEPVKEEAVKETPTKEETKKKGKVIYSANGIVVTYKGTTSNNALTNKQLNLTIENTLDRDLTVQVRNFTVNEESVYPIFSCDVSEGKTVNDEIYIMQSDLDANEIKDLKEYEFSFYVYDRADWAYRIESEKIRVKV